MSGRAKEPHGGDTQRHGSRHVLAILGVHVKRLVKIDDFARYLYGVLGGVEARDLSYAADAVPSRLPEVFPADPVGTDRSNSSDHNSTLHRASWTLSFWLLS